MTATWGVVRLDDAEHAIGVASMDANGQPGAEDVHFGAAVVGD